jgi:transposase
MVVLTEEQWAVLEPLIEVCRPRGKTPLHHLRRTIEAIIWRHVNGAKWRAIPAELGPWWKAAQTFIRGSRLGVWPRRLEAAQGCAVQLGMAFLDGTSIRAHHKAAGAPKKGEARDSGTGGKRWAARAAALAPRPASSLTARAVPSPSRWRPVQRTNCRWRPRCSIASPA